MHGGLYMVQVSVPDVPVTARWYRDMLGLELLMADAQGKFALMSAGSCRLALKRGRSKPGVVRLHFQIGDLDGEILRLRNLGLTVSEVKASDEGYRRVLVEDPAGYEVALFEWTKPQA